MFVIFLVLYTINSSKLIYIYDAGDFQSSQQYLSKIYTSEEQMTIALKCLFITNTDYESLNNPMRQIY